MLQEAHLFGNSFLIKLTVLVKTTLNYLLRIILLVKHGIGIQDFMVQIKFGFLNYLSMKWKSVLKINFGEKIKKYLQSGSDLQAAAKQLKMSNSIFSGKFLMFAWLIFC